VTVGTVAPGAGVEAIGAVGAGAAGTFTTLPASNMIGRHAGP